MIQGLPDSTSNFISLFNAIIGNAITLMSRIKVPFLHRSFYSLYIQIFAWSIGIMIFKYFFAIGLDDNNDLAVVKKIRVSKERRFDGIVKED